MFGSHTDRERGREKEETERERERDRERERERERKRDRNYNKDEERDALQDYNYKEWDHVHGWTRLGVNTCLLNNIPWCNRL